METCDVNNKFPRRDQRFYSHVQNSSILVISIPKNVQELCPESLSSMLSLAGEVKNVLTF